MLQKRARGKVHLVLSTHARKDYYLPRRLLKGTETILDEVPFGDYGDQKRRRSIKGNIQEWKEKALSGVPFKVDTGKKLLLARKRGIKIFPGELVRNKKELEKFRNIFSLRKDKLMHARQTRKIKDIQKYFEAEHSFLSARHALIRRAIRESTMPTVARYGSTHSLLSRELLDEGIRSTREIEPTVFDYRSRVFRMLMRGEKPSDIMYLKGWIISNMQFALPTKFRIENNSDHKLFSDFTTIVLDRLPEETIKRLASQEETPFNQICELAGLPQNPSRRTIQRFLMKYSIFYQREAAKRRFRKNLTRKAI